MTKLTRICVLLAVGVNPANCRGRRSSVDAQALELALRFGEQNDGACVDALHVGSPSDERSLRDYLGMGLGSLSILAPEPGVEPAATAAAHLSEAEYDLVLAGSAARDGGASGVFPYQVAKQMALPVLPDVTHLEESDGVLMAKQARERGVRQKFEVRGRSLMTVSPLAPAARLPSFVLAREGTLRWVNSNDERRIDPSAEVLQSPKMRAALPMRKSLATFDPNASAEDRLKAVTALKGGAGKLHDAMEPELIATEILARLKALGVTPD